MGKKRALTKVVLQTANPVPPLVAESNPVVNSMYPKFFFFPTCQVRVVRFYQSCSPHPPSPPPPPPPLAPPPVSPRPCLHQLPRPLPPFQLVANLFANFRAQWALLDLNCWLRPCHLVANLFANFRAQWALLDLNCRLWPCQLVANLFANFRAQWAPLDLNLGPSELSGHCWTSTAR